MPGETGGILDTILQRLATYIEKSVKLRPAVSSALIYPGGDLAGFADRGGPAEMGGACLHQTF